MALTTPLRRSLTGSVASALGIGSGMAMAEGASDTALALHPGIEDGSADLSDSDTDKAWAALAAGHVYVDIGTRGRGNVAADGTLPGTLPAAVVDAKAAIRWLHLKAAALPGPADRTAITGNLGIDGDVLSVDARLPWMVPHGGTYDVQEAYTWLAGVIAAPQ